MHGEAGKGDTPRPKSISEEEYQKKFRDVFGNKLSWFETEEHKKWVEEANEEKKRLVQEPLGQAQGIAQLPLKEC